METREGQNVPATCDLISILAHAMGHFDFTFEDGVPIGRRHDKDFAVKFEPLAEWQQRFIKPMVTRGIVEPELHVTHINGAAGKGAVLLGGDGHVLGYHGKREHQTVAHHFNR